MKARMKEIFAPPVFDDAIKNNQAYLLNIILWMLLFLPVPFLAFVNFADPQGLPRALIQTAVGTVVNLFLLFILKRGNVLLACHLQVILFWLFFMLSAATESGVKGIPYLMGSPLVIIIAGVLLGGQMSTLIALLTMLVGAWMVYAETAGIINPTGTNDSLTLWMLSIFVFPVIASLQHISSRATRTALNRAGASEERYKLISRVSNDYIFEARVDERGHNQLIWVGGAFEKMTGYTFEEYLATGGWEAHVHPDDREQDEQDMSTLFNNQDVKTDIRTIHKNGGIRWERVSAHPIWDEKQKKLVGIVGAVDDITDSKKADDALKESYLQQTAILNNIPDMAWLKDRNGIYVAVNEQYNRVSGKSMAEIIGKSDLEIWDEDFAKKYRSDDDFVIKTKQRRSLEEEQRDHTGRHYWVETVKTPIFNASGEVVGTTGIAREITERKLAEFQQQHRREMLEKVIELGKYVTKPDNLRATIKKIWHGVHDTLGFDRPAIFLYNQELNQMDDILGTDNQGQMVDNYGVSFVIEEGTDGTTFGNILKSPDGYYFTEKYTLENNLLPGYEMGDVKDFAAVAAWAGDKPVAVICADNAITQDPITQEQLEALRLFSGYAGLAIENARLQETIQSELAQQILSEERERERRAILEKVVNLGQYVTEVKDLRTTLSRVWYGVRNDLGFDRIGIYLYNSTHDSMSGTFGTGDQGEILDEWHVSIPMNQVNLESKPFIRVMEKPDTIYVNSNYENDFAAIAAWAGEKLVAVLRVDNKITGRPISNEQLEALRLFAGYAGLAIENSRLNTALQGELAQRKTFIEELEAKNAELERFTYTVSHDLKSPLVTITGFLGYIEKDAHTGNLDKLKNNIDRVNAAVEKMQRLLRDLLELSRIGRLINPPVEIPFKEIVKDATEIVQGQIKAGNVVVEFCDNNEIVKGDQVRLVEVLQNLLDNAIKFMGDQPNPRIEINSFKTDEGKAVFFVRDNGIGIARQYHEKIFGLFNKLNTDTSGTGIGLTLIKRIIEVHGGRIWVESEVGKGTTFYFTLQ